MASISENLNFYEVMAVLVPGTVLLLGLAFLTGIVAAPANLAEATVGAFGFFLIGAYVTGFLLQTLAAIVEKVYWAVWKGRPTDWVRLGEGRLLSQEQEQVLLSRTGFSTPSEQQWHAAYGLWTTQVRASVPENRLQRFLGNYGLARGIVAAALALGVAHLWLNGFAWSDSLGLLLGASALGLWRMHTSAIDYAKELFRCYLSIPSK